MRIYLAAPHTLTRYKGGVEWMRIYLAGGITGNLKPAWKDAADRMAAGQPVEEAVSEAMQAYNPAADPDPAKYRPAILESFFYMDERTEKLLPFFGDFLLDSGAFTFSVNNSSINWNDYTERYAEYIRRNKIEKFFELDIDSIIGYKQVLKLRADLERLTGRQPIPVWHVSRGKDEFIRMCDEYPYVALGGYVAGIRSGDPKQQAYVKSYPWFIQQAHRRGAKIHGLGYTSLAGLKKHHFDSVDSTAWTTGNRFGYIYKFNGETMIKKQAPPGSRIADPRRAALINFHEWVKFQQYAETNL